MHHSQGESSLNNSNKVQVNYSIQARRVLIIDENGRNLGEFMRNDAIKIAEDKGLDLVMVSGGNAPACRIMDYGKFVYNQKKKAKDSRAGAVRVKTKEVRMSPRIADGDMDVRIARVREFVGKGNHVKVTMRFKGSDMRHIDIARDRCNDLISAVSDVTTIEQPPRMNGRQMTILLSPK
jgi:translation initiation factor IF-3